LAFQRKVGRTRKRTAGALARVRSNVKLGVISLKCLAARNSKCTSAEDVSEEKRGCRDVRAKQRCRRHLENT
jgi:hypothetical protein